MHMYTCRQKTSRKPTTPTTGLPLEMQWRWLGKAWLARRGRWGRHSWPCSSIWQNTRWQDRSMGSVRVSACIRGLVPTTPRYDSDWCIHKCATRSGAECRGTGQRLCLDSAAVRRQAYNHCVCVCSLCLAGPSGAALPRPHASHRIAQTIFQYSTAISLMTRWTSPLHVFLLFSCLVRRWHIDWSRCTYRPWFVSVCIHLYICVHICVEIYDINRYLYIRIYIDVFQGMYMYMYIYT